MVTRWERELRRLSIPSPLEGGLHYEDALLAQVGQVVYYGRELDQIVSINNESIGGPYFLLLNFGFVCYSVVTFPAEIGADWR